MRYSCGQIEGLERAHYLTDAANVELACMVRDRFIKDPPPADTLVVIQGLDPPALLFEIEGVAAQA